jgi:hypothetical protein
MYHTRIRIATSPVSIVGTHQWADLVYNRAGEPLARGKLSLARGIHCCPCFLSFFLPDQRLHIVQKMCLLYIHISECVETVYELLLLPNNNAGEIFLTNWERCKLLTGYLSLTCRPGGDWASTGHWT